MQVVNAKLTAAVVVAFTGKVADLTILQDKAIQKVSDAMRLACDVPVLEFMKGTAVKNPARKQIAEMFTEIVTAGGLKQKTANNYATSFWIAFEQNVPFQRSLFEAGRKAKAATDTKATDTKATDTKKAGSVKTTDRAALDATICKALQQARLLGLTEFAAEILDICLESLDGFTEVAAK